MVRIDVDVLSNIKYIAENCPDAYVRIVLERGNEETKYMFAKLCAWLEETYPDIIFFGGTYKPTWQYLYKFHTSPAVEQTLCQHIGSMSHQWWGRVFPRLWAHLHRHDMPDWASDPDIPIVFLDFV